MSNLAQAWAWQQDVPASTKSVLLALADNADDDGICWPGVKLVAEKCRLSKEAIRYHLRVLRRKGLLFATERKRPDGSQTSNVYRLPVNMLTPPYQTLNTLASISEEGGIKGLIPWNPKGTQREPSLKEDTPNGVSKKVLTKEQEPPKRAVELPEWVDPEVWADFLEMRAKQRASPTPRAKQLIISELAKFLQDGDDPNEVLRRSTMNNWKGVFPLKDRERSVNGNAKPGADSQGNSGQGTYVPGSLTERTRRQNERIAAGKV